MTSWRTFARTKYFVIKWFIAANNLINDRFGLSATRMQRSRHSISNAIRKFMREQRTQVDCIDLRNFFFFGLEIKTKLNYFLIDWSIRSARKMELQKVKRYLLSDCNEYQKWPLKTKSFKMAHEIVCGMSVKWLVRVHQLEHKTVVQLSV